MGLTKYKLGELIQQRREKYDGATDLPIRGVSRDGFIDAKQPGADTSLYNTFYMQDFVFNPARMEVNSIALNNEFEKAICSSLYEVFYIIDKDIILPEYLNLFVKRPEFARQCEYIGWGSAREYCRVANISDISIDLPPLAIQQKYVDVYKAMLANQQAYEQSLDHINVAITASVEAFKHTAPRVALGTLLEEVDVRNRDGSITNVQGINISKEFMPSVANLKSVDLKKYKVIRKNQFAYSSMQTGRDECIRVALYHEDMPAIISPAYSILQVKSQEVLAEYLMLWFGRKESDRYGWFISDSSVRASLELSRFYEIEIPLPTMEQQESVVRLYEARHLIQQNMTTLGNTIKQLCPILIKGSLEEASA